MLRTHTSLKEEKMKKAKKTANWFRRNIYESQTKNKSIKC